MNLKPMSLKQKEQQQQDTTEQAIKSEAYVTPSDEDTPPILEISEYGKLVLYSYKDIFLRAGRTIKTDSDYISLESDSNYSISEIFKNWGAIGKSDLEHMEEFNDVLILGALCKVLCKVELPALQVITKYSNLFEQFVKETFDCYYSSAMDYAFSVDRALKLVSKKVNPDISSGDNLAKYVLLKNVKNVGAVVLAALRVDKYLISLTYLLPDYHELVVPLSIATSDLEHYLLDCLYDSLIWILLSRTDFCVNKWGSFYLLEKDDNKKHLKHSTIYEHTVFKPFSVNSIFQNTIKKF